MGHAPQDERQAAGVEWAFRAAAEGAQRARFERLAERLHAVGALPVITDGARRAAEDEARHAGVCARLAEGLGASAAESPPVHFVTLPTLPAAARVLYEVVSVCCVTESLNAAVLTTTLEVASDRAVRAAVRALLRDEVGHARLGWAHLTREAQRVDVAFLGPLLPAMLAASVREEVFARVAVPPEEGAARDDYGRLTLALRGALVREALTAVVLPGLEGCGVPVEPARRWLDARAPPGA
ncbi:MAG: ferritin-like domain-containing protein [Deltaproteobacteria bacterium]|nr:ferritin-like domain-containing protein [Deltaproteobacteria bacterium]